MPLQKLALRPGVNRENTSYANEGGYYSSNKIRFRSGQPEKIGGWVADTGTNLSPLLPPTGTLWGVCRSLWNWINLAGSNLLAIGTHLKYYIQSGVNGFYYDVTPLRNPAGTTVGSNAFTTTASSATGYVTVVCNATGHGTQTGDFVTISNVATAVNGIPAASLNSEFRATYIDTGRFSIQVYVASAVTAGTTGAATFTYQLGVGSDIYTQNLGWGAGPWGGAAGPSATTVLSSSLTTVGMSILDGALTSSDTTITVASTSTLTTTGSVLIDSEVISYTGRTATTLTGCTRGASSTTAATHSTGVGVVQYSSITISVSDSSGFDASGIVYIDGEGVSYSGKGSGTLTGCVRGINGYVTSHASLAEVNQYASTATGWGASAPAGLGVAQQLRLWSQTNFGEDLIFNPRGGAMYYWANSTSLTTFNPGQLLGPSSTITVKSGATVSVDSSCPSIVNFVMVSDASRFVIAFGCTDYGSVVLDPLLIRWSDQESFATWVPSATNQAGSYRLSSGSQIITAIQTRQEILVLTDAAIYSMQYLGPPYVWGFQILGDNISIAGPNAIAIANGMAYWMGTDKFYMYSGRVQTLPSTLREYVYSDINLTQSYQFVAGTNEGYNEVWWQYCSANSNVIDRYVIYNHLDEVWYYGDWSNYTSTKYQGRTAWRDSPLRAFPMAATYGIAAAAGDEYVGGNALLVYHESGVDDGVVNPPRPIVSQVTSSDFDIGDGHNFGFVWRLIPDLTFDGSFSAAPQAMFTVLPRANPGANYGPSNNPEVISAQNYQATRTYAIQQFTQQVYVRIRGRQMAFQVSSGTVGSSTDGVGVQWQLGIPRIDIRPDGRR